MKGIVVDQNSVPMINAAVIVLGKSTGTLTSTAGEFNLVVLAQPVTLRVTAPGCVSLDTTILNHFTTLSLMLNCDDPTRKSNQEEIHKRFLEGKFEIPFLLREKIQLGRFDLENLLIDSTCRPGIQLNGKLPSNPITNFKLRTIKPKLLAVTPVMSNPVNIIDELNLPTVYSYRPN